MSWNHADYIAACGAVLQAAATIGWSYSLGRISAQEMHDRQETIRIHALRRAIGDKVYDFAYKFLELHAVIPGIASNSPVKIAMERLSRAIVNRAIETKFDIQVLYSDSHFNRTFTFVEWMSLRRSELGGNITHLRQTRVEGWEFIIPNQSPVSPRSRGYQLNAPPFWHVNQGLTRNTDYDPRTWLSHPDNSPRA